MSRIRFHWWYLLFLLPVAGYFGTRWWVDSKIQSLIEQRNTDGNELRVGDYSFGFFPLHLEVRDVAFEQEAKNVRGSGRVARAGVSGLSLWNLIGSGTIEVGEVYVDSARVEGARTQVREDTTRQVGRGRDFEIGTLKLTAVDLSGRDEPTRRRFGGNGLTLTVEGIASHLRPGALGAVELTADSLYYGSPRDSVLLRYADYGSAARTTRLGQFFARRTGAGTTYELTGDDLDLLGVSHEAIGDSTLRVERFHLGRLAGTLELTPVPDTSATASARTEVPDVYVEAVDLPDVQLTVAGGFGAVDYGGHAAVTAQLVDAQAEVTDGTIAADTLAFRGAEGLTAQTRYLLLDWRGVRDRPGRPIPDVHLGPARADHPKGNLKIDSLSYTAADGRTLVVAPRGNAYVDDNRYSLTAARLTTVIEEPRTLTGDTLELPELDLSEPTFLADLGNPKRERYRYRAPELRLTGLYRTKATTRLAGVTTERARIQRFTSDDQLKLDARDVTVRQGRVVFPFSPDDFGDSDLAVRRVRLYDDEEQLDYVFHNVRYDSPAGRLRLDSLNRVTRLEPGPYLANRVSDSWLDFSFGKIDLRGFERTPFLKQEAFLADRMTVETFYLATVEDLGDPDPGPDTTDYKPYPLEALRDLDRRIRLPELTIGRADITYGAVDSVYDAKTIRFADLRARITGIDTEVAPGDSIIAEATTTFEGQAPIEARFALARSVSGRDFAMTGRMEGYDLSGINPLATVAADALVESGQIHQLEYSAALTDGVSEGWLRLHYDSLDVKLVGSGAWYKNLLSDFVVKNDNVPGEDFRLGTIYYEAPTDKSFWNAYWQSLVAGMKSSVLAEIVTPKELDKKPGEN